MDYQIFDLGDQGCTFQLRLESPSATSISLLKRMEVQLHHQPFAGLLDIVVAYDSLSVLFDRFIIFERISGDVTAFVQAQLIEAYRKALVSNDTAFAHHWKIPVCYDLEFGIDLQSICNSNGLSVNEIISIHQSKVYSVFMIGFLPGFPYLGFVDETIITPRKPSPVSVKAGSVGIAGKQTGIYPLDSPGGWQIIGRTPMALFTPTNSPPVEMQAGDTLSFYAITKDEFHSMSIRR
jgi:inhibitor of KinA